MTIDFKADIDLVTHVDKEVEDYVISALREKYPSHSFLAEESAAAAGWFLRKQKYSISPTSPSFSYPLWQGAIH